MTEDDETDGDEQHGGRNEEVQNDLPKPKSKKSQTMTIRLEVYMNDLMFAHILWR